VCTPPGLDRAVVAGALDAVAPFAGGVALGEVRDDRVAVGEVAGISHSEGGKDPLFGELGERFPGEPVDQLGGEDPSGVGVEVALTRLVVGFRRADDDVDRVEGVAREGPPGLAPERPEIPQSAGLAEGPAPGHPVRIGRHFREVLPDRVIERKFAVLLEEQHGHGGELLRDGADVEHRAGREGHPVFEAGHAVAARVAEGAVLVDAEGASGGVRAVECPEDTVDAHGLTVARSDDVLSRKGARRSERQEGSERESEMAKHHDNPWWRIGNAIKEWR
jgi:hypothetical protein